MMATNPEIYLVSADQFLAMEFGPEEKVELDNGVIRMMSGGTARHAMVQLNISAFLRSRLRGTGCTPYNSDMAARTHDLSVRYPDITVYCGDKPSPSNDRKLAFDDPVVVIEILSPSTAQHDQKDKLIEYQALASVETILFVDTDRERVRIVQRTSPEGWADNWIMQGEDILLPALRITIPHTEMFARD
jgi:Uma2 family endonuclease